MHCGGSDREFDKPACKKTKKWRDCIGDILLEKKFNVSDGIEIHGNLTGIVENVLKVKSEEGRRNQIKKRCLRPKNRDMLAEIRAYLYYTLREDTYVRSQTPEDAKVPY